MEEEKSSLLSISEPSEVQEEISTGDGGGIGVGGKGWGRANGSPQGRYRMSFIPTHESESEDTNSVKDLSSTKGVPEGWFNRRVNNVENPPILTERTEEISQIDPRRRRHEWENELARHILSVYASTQVANSDLGKIGAYPAANSKVIMDFVDPRETVDELRDELFSVNEEVASCTQVADGEEPINVTKDLGIESTGKENAKKDALSARKEAKKVARELKMKKIAEEAKKKAVRDATIADVMAKLEEQEKDAEEAAKYRVSTKIVTKEGKEVIIRGQPKVFPIWFTSTGEIYSDWSLLPGGEKLQAHLKEIYEKSQYIEYLEIVKRLLDDEWVNLSKAMGGDEEILNESKSVSRDQASTDGDTLKNYALLSEEAKPNGHLPLKIMILLWRQLVLTCNAMASIAVQNKKPDLCGKILRLAESYSSRTDVLTPEIRRELKAYVNESSAYFYFRKKNYGIAANLIRKALQEYESRGADFNQHLAICKLRVGCIESLNSQYKKSHEIICEVAV